MPKTWYLFSQGESFGPLPTDVVKVMLKQKRVTITEFIWSEGMERWERIRDVAEFGDKNLPPYPPVDIPPLQEGFGEEEVAAEEDETAEVAEAAEEEEAEVEEVVAEEVEEEAEEVEEVVAEEEPAEEEATAVAAAPAVRKVKPAAPAPAPAKKAGLKLVKPAPAAKPAPKPAAPAVAKTKPKPKAVAKPAPKPAPVLKPKKRKDIRGADRCKIDGTVAINGGAPGKIVDMSETGCLTECAEAFEPGTPVEFVLESSELETTPWQMTGMIVRVVEEGTPQVGIEFTRVNPAYKRVLTQVVKAKTSRE